MLKVVLLAVVPTVVEESSRGERAMDLYSGLLRKRIIVLSDPIAPQTASLTVAQLLHLEAEDAEKDIQLYINSPGGSVTDMFAVLDTMTYVSPDVQTVCVGQAASAAAVLLAAGTPGKRVLLPHARVLLHQPRGGTQGQSSDIAIVADEILRLNDTINQRLAEYTGQTVEQIAEDLDRDFILTAEDAVEYGIADMVVATRHGQQNNLKAA